MAESKCGCVIVRLDPVLDLEPERLAESRRPERHVQIAVDKDSRVTPLPGPVIETDAADDVRPK